MGMTILQVFNGLSVSSILLLIALGLAVTFGLMNVINMAHGELIMIGAYSTYVTQGLFTAYMPKSWFDTYFIVALLVSFLVAPPSDGTLKWCSYAICTAGRWIVCSPHGASG